MLWCLDQGGERELVLGADDHLMKESSRSIPRQDVAELCVQCLGVSEAQNRYWMTIVLPIKLSMATIFIFP